MVATTDPFATWLAHAQIPAHRLTPPRQALLEAAFRFRQSQGTDYYTTRLLGHFLLHCGSGLKVAQVARLLGISRPTASRQQALSSKEVVQQAHHRLGGKPHGKLLPRYAGPIAQFLLTNPRAPRADLIDFIDRTWDVRVSRIALYKFLKKFGLDEATRHAATPAPSVDDPGDPAPPAPPTIALPPPAPASSPPQPVPTPAPPFSSHARSTPGRSS